MHVGLHQILDMWQNPICWLGKFKYGWFLPYGSDDKGARFFVRVDTDPMSWWLPKKQEFDINYLKLMMHNLLLLFLKMLFIGSQWKLEGDDVQTVVIISKDILSHWKSMNITINILFLLKSFKEYIFPIWWSIWIWKINIIFLISGLCMKNLL